MITENEIKTITRGAKHWDIELKTGTKIELELVATRRWTVGVDITINGKIVQSNCDVTPADKKLWQTVSDISAKIHKNEMNLLDSKRDAALEIYNNLIS